MVSIVVVTTYYLASTGYSYYALPLEERFYHDKYEWFKPSGIMGHTLGVIGTFLIAFGVFIYIARKRYGFLGRFIRLKYLLEFHIFLCVLGPIMILFHTTFKFGGVVAIAFWSMVAVVLSGVVGRFIYIQIPRTIEGRELSIQDIQNKREDFAEQIRNNKSITSATADLILSNNEAEKWGLRTAVKNYTKIQQIKKNIKNSNLSKTEQRAIIDMAKEEMALASKIGRLQQMQKLFKYWHVVHMPFAIVMLIIVLIHVGVTLTLGYKGIF
jgi:hypothetical protein